MVQACLWPWQYYILETVLDRCICLTRLLAKWESGKRSDNSNEWDFASLAEVKQNFRLTNYPLNLLYTHVGDVASTLPGSDVSSIAILRLDTDLLRVYEG